jgi:hypothetical protein
VFSINHRMGGPGSATASSSTELPCAAASPPRRSVAGSCKKLLLLLAPMLLWAGPSRAEEFRYGHGDAEVSTTSLPHGCLGRGCVLIDKAERWVAKVPWILQDEMFEPTSITFPELPVGDGRASCLVYWDVYVPVGAQAVWHVRYAGELRRQNGAWRIRYYSTATLHSVTA